MRQTDQTANHSALTVVPHEIHKATDLTPDELQEILIGKYLCKLFRNQRPSPPEELTFLESIGLHLGESGFSVIIFHVDEPASEKLNHGARRSNAELCRDLCTLVRQIMKKHLVCYCTEVDDKVALLICNLYTSADYVSHYKARFTEYCSEIITRARTELSIRCSAMISSIAKNVESIAMAFRTVCHEMDFRIYSHKFNAEISYVTELPEINHYQLWLNISEQAQVFVDAILKLDREAAIDCSEYVIMYLSSFCPISNSIFLNNLQSFFDSAVYIFIENGIFSSSLMWKYNTSRLIHTTADITELRARIEEIVDFFISKNVRYKSEIIQNRILEIRQYISAHASEYDMSVTRVADAFRISPALLSSQFKKAYGQTPSLFLTQERVALAKELLSSSALSLEDICEKAGFGSLSTLNRAFKHLTGQTPSQYRKKIRL